MARTKQTRKLWHAQATPPPPPPVNRKRRRLDKKDGTTSSTTQNSQDNQNHKHHLKHQRPRYQQQQYSSFSSSIPPHDPVHTLLSPARDAIEDLLFCQSDQKGGLVTTWPKFEWKQRWEAVRNDDEFYVRIKRHSSKDTATAANQVGTDVIASIAHDDSNKEEKKEEYCISFVHREQQLVQRQQQEHHKMKKTKRYVFAELTRETVIFPFQSLVLEKCFFKDYDESSKKSNVVVTKECPPTRHHHHHHRIVGYDAVLDELGLYEREHLKGEEQDELLGRWSRPKWYDVIRVSPSHVPRGYKLFWSILPGTNMDEVANGGDVLHFVVPPELNDFVHAPEDIITQNQNHHSVWVPKPKEATMTMMMTSADNVSTTTTKQKEKQNKPRQECCFLLENNPDMLLRVLAFLAPHELLYMRAACQAIFKIFESSHKDAILYLQLQSVFSYFAILRDVASEVKHLVDGGWNTFADFLMHVAVRLDRSYHHVVPPLLHRAFLGEVALSNLFGGEMPGCLALHGPFHSELDEAVDNPNFSFDVSKYYPRKGSGGEARKKVKLSFQRCFPTSGGLFVAPDYRSSHNILLPMHGTEEDIFDYYKDEYHRNNDKEDKMRQNLATTIDATAKMAKDGRLNQFAKQRTAAGLSALVWIFTYRDTEHRHFMGLGIGSNMEELVYELTTEQHTTGNLLGCCCRGLVDLFVNYPLVDDYSLFDMKDEIAIARAMWCKAHGIPPFGGGNNIDGDDGCIVNWESLIPTASDIRAARHESNLYTAGVAPTLLTCPEWFISYARYLLDAKRADTAEFCKKKSQS